MNRIRVLDPLFHTVRELRLWSDSDTGTSAWEVTFATGRFFLMLSPELYRGFSGEGQVLEKLAGRRWREALPYVQSRLAWQSQIDSAALAREIGLTVEEVDDALAVLGSRGLAGYDVTAGRYFHRELPFDLEQVETLQPRLEGRPQAAGAAGRLGLVGPRRRGLRSERGRQRSAAPRAAAT